MAFEQLYAFLEDRPQDELGLTTEIGPDNFPILESSDLRAEHEVMNDFLSSRAFSYAYGGDLEDLPTIFQGDEQQRTRYFMALLERIFAYEARLHNRSPEEHRYDRVFGCGPAHTCLAAMIEAGVNLDAIAVPTLRWLAAHKNLYYTFHLIRTMITAVSSKYGKGRITDEMKQPLIDVRSMMFDLSYADPVKNKAVVSAIDDLIGDGAWQVVLPGEVWTDQMLVDLELMPAAERKSWFVLLQLCGTAKTAKPNAKWTKAATTLLKDVGEDQFSSKVVEWFAHVDKGRSRSILGGVWGLEDRQRINDYNADVLRGLLWICIYVSSPDICRAISRMAISAYRKVRGVGPRAVKVGNAAVYVLGEIATEEAVGQLAVLKVRVKLSTAQNGIEKALLTAAERVGIPRHELEEMSVPSYGLTDIGLRRDNIGDYTAEIVVDGSSTAFPK